MPVYPGARLTPFPPKIYDNLKPWFPFHESVCHYKGEYARRGFNGRKIHTNTVEGFFSLVKRGVYGTYHHWSKYHMHRYLAEFDFRYNHRYVGDGERMIAALAQTGGKRLTYRPLTKGE